MKQVKVFLMLALLWASNVNGQELSLKWSQEIKQKNSEDGHFRYFLGSNDKYVYAYFANISAKQQFKIVAFEKNTMKKKHVAEVIGFPSNAKESSKYRKIRFYKTIIYDNVVYAFFKSSDKSSNKVLVKSFSPDLKETNKLRVVTSQPTRKDRKNKEATPFVIGNKEVGKVFIGVEKEAKPKSKIKLEYKVLKEDFTFSEANQIELPVEYIGSQGLLMNSSGLSTSYDFGDDGNIHFSSIYRKYDNKKDRKKGYKKGKKSGKSKSEIYDSFSYTILSTIDLKTNKYYSVPLKSDRKRLFSTKRMIRKGNTRLYGYFSDYNKDKRGSEIHGIFYAVLNENYEVENLRFSQFDKKMIKEMYKTDRNEKDGGRKGGCCITGKKGSTHAEDGTVNPNYIIEDAVEGENGSIYLVTTIMYNYTVTVCTTDQNGNRSCHEEPRCYKGNVTTFKVNKEGDIVWGSNHDRSKTYKRWNVYDVNAIHDENGLYVTYADYRNFEKKRRFFIQLFQKLDRTYPMDYLYINKTDGKIKKKTLKVNSPKTKRRQAKYVEPTRITVVDNKFYVNDQTENLNPLGYATYACCYVWMIPEIPFALRLTSNKFGYFGVLQPK